MTERFQGEMSSTSDSKIDEFTLSRIKLIQKSTSSCLKDENCGPSWSSMSLRYVYTATGMTVELLSTHVLKIDSYISIQRYSFGTVEDNFSG